MAENDANMLPAAAQAAGQQPPAGVVGQPPPPVQQEPTFDDLIAEAFEAKKIDGDQMTAIARGDGDPKEIILAANREKRISSATCLAMLRAHAPRTTPMTTPTTATSTGASELTTYLREAELNKHYPWRHGKKIHDDKMAKALKEFQDSPEACRERFIADCKAGLVAPELMIPAMFAIFGSPSDLPNLAALLLCATGIHDFIKTYNWWIAEQNGETYITAHGDVIANLTWPLFPETTAFRQLASQNLTMLSEARKIAAGCAGGAPPRSFVPHGYRNCNCTTPGQAIAGGAYYVPVEQTTSGYAVDIQPAVDAHHDTARQIQELRQKLAQVQQQSTRGGDRRPQRGGRGGERSAQDGGRGVQDGGRGGTRDNRQRARGGQRYTPYGGAEPDQQGPTGNF